MQIFEGVARLREDESSEQGKSKARGTQQMFEADQRDVNVGGCFPAALHGS